MPSPEADEDRILRVSVVSYPLLYFAVRIGGHHVEVSFPAPPDVDPAFWSPDPETVGMYQQADLILLNGARYARWVERASLPSSKLVDTSRAFRDRYVVAEEAITHSHGPEGDHSHGEIAFTTWIDPMLAVEHARAILAAFMAARPEHAATFQEGYATLEADLLDLDRQFEAVFAQVADQPLVASHPVYQYLARRYRLAVRSVHFEPGQYPGEREWRGLRKILASHPARWMLWEGEPLGETTARLTELAVAVIVFDPSSNRPPEGDFLSTMRDNLKRLETAVREGRES
jgi:zinc transport system substrate-binding protein